jgi:uncharacterized protein (DUF849 family)
MVLIQAALNGGTTRAGYRQVPLSPAELAGHGSTSQVRHGYDLATWHVLRAAIADGQDIRVGLEDTRVLPDGSAAEGNADLVAAAVRLPREF